MRTSIKNRLLVTCHNIELPNAFYNIFQPMIKSTFNLHEAVAIPCPSSSLNGQKLMVGHLRQRWKSNMMWPLQTSRYTLFITYIHNILTPGLSGLYLKRSPCLPHVPNITINHAIFLWICPHLTAKRNHEFPCWTLDAYHMENTQVSRRLWSYYRLYPYVDDLFCVCDGHPLVH